MHITRQIIRNSVVVLLAVGAALGVSAPVYAASATSGSTVVQPMDTYWD